MHYYVLSHGEPVGDACAPSRPNLRWARDEGVRGRLFRHCEIGEPDHECFSFGGQANLCTEPATVDAFSAIDFVRTLVLLRRAPQRETDP
jgi:hypothetical protein